jgi:GT2 family glycosyltransferase
VPIKEDMKTHRGTFQIQGDEDEFYPDAENGPKGPFAIADEISTVDLVVNIATSGRSDLLERTLKSLGDCELPAGYVETVVIENGSRGGAEKVVRSAPDWLNARYMHFTRGNKSAALNAALETIADGLIFYTDDDVRLAPETLCAYSDFASRHGAGCFYGGPMNVDYDAPPPDWLRGYLPPSATGWELNQDQQGARAATFLGCNWAAFAEDLRAAGGFNVNFGPGSPTGSTGQETEMQDRLIRHGLSGVYVPAARVWHYVPQNRCTPQWALERNFKNGLQDAARLERAGGAWGLPPWWVTRQYLRGMLGEFRGLLSTDPERRFRAKSRHSYDRGLMLGIMRQSEATETRRAA